MTDKDWPALAYDAWSDTRATLHMWMQIVGKVALAEGPPLNHSWGVAFQLTPRGLATPLLHHDRRSFRIEFDFVDHQLCLDVSDGQHRQLPLVPMSVADFYQKTMALLSELAMPVRIWTVPSEVPDPIRFELDTVHRAYDREYVSRFWRILDNIAGPFIAARRRFVGKCSPLHFFWGGFDLALTRFSGRPAPPRDGPAFMREAYSHEVISHGFWPGSAPMFEPAFYAYAVPEPPGLQEAQVRPDAAHYHRALGEFILPYEAVRRSAAPEAAITDFINTTYEAAAALAHWDRGALER
jgi:hypothetical protein